MVDSLRAEGGIIRHFDVERCRHAIVTSGVTRQRWDTLSCEGSHQTGAAANPALRMPAEAGGVRDSERIAVVAKVHLNRRNKVRVSEMHLSAVR
jgi:hypothetical protein